LAAPQAPALAPAELRGRGTDAVNRVRPGVL